jgi:hypothetical protein
MNIVPESVVIFAAQTRAIEHASGVSISTQAGTAYALDGGSIHIPILCIEKQGFLVGLRINHKPGLT